MVWSIAFTTESVNNLQLYAQLASEGNFDQSLTKISMNDFTHELCGGVVVREHLIQVLEVVLG